MYLQYAIVRVYDLTMRLLQQLHSRELEGKRNTASMFLLQKIHLNMTETLRLRTGPCLPPGGNNQSICLFFVKDRRLL